MKSTSGIRADEVCCVVITYNPDSLAATCLGNTLANASHTVVIDNGSTAESLAGIKHICAVGGRATLVENDTNFGVAAALNAGIKAAASLGYRWFLLLDQDTYLLEGAIQSLARACHQCMTDDGLQVAMTAANYFHQDADGSALPARVPYADGRLWVRVDSMITSGTLISLPAFEEIGLFREDFFIDSIDHEYCFRAMRKGFVMIQTAQPLMLHRLGMVVNRRVWYRLRRRVTLSGHSPLRRYYQVRNFVVMAAEYRRDFPALMSVLQRDMVRDLKRSVLYEGRPVGLLRAILRGFLDARIGRMGKCPVSL